MTKNSSIYFDHNATTPLDSKVFEAMQEVAELGFANPGSKHPAGRKARQFLEDARESIASNLGCQPTELIFTSGGTESINLAVFGLTQSYPKPQQLASTAGEHPAVRMAVEQLEAKGWTNNSIQLDSNGMIDTDLLPEIPWQNVKLATSLWGHNETGVIQNLNPLQEICSKNLIPLHIDALQMVGKMRVNFKELDVAALSFGAHKFNGPRGIGGLILKSGYPFKPQLFGGFQEAERRAGTEPVMLAVGMAKALEQWESNREERMAKIKELRDLFLNGIQQQCGSLVLHGEKSDRIENTLYIAFPEVDAEAMLVAFDLQGICCSSGSACASGAIEPSPILLAMGCSEATAKSSIRFSFGWQNSVEEIELAISKIASTVNRLRNQ